MIDLKYPVLLLHGLFYRDRFKRYWGRIPEFLRNEGVKVFLGGHDGSVSVERNGEFLAERIKEICQETGAEKVNIIGHCKGGLDARYAITRAGAAPYVASLTSLGVPHMGSMPLEKGLKKTPKWFLRALVRVLNAWFKLRGDKDPDVLAGTLDCTPTAAEKFNRETPDDPNVYYQSYAFVNPGFFITPILFPFHLIVSHEEGENDGLLSPCSAKWSNFKGVVRSNGRSGISHCDIADWRRRPLTKKKGPGVSDMLDFYRDLFTDLAERGF